MVLRSSGAARVDAIADVGGRIRAIEAIFTAAGGRDALAWVRVRDVSDVTRVVDLLRMKEVVVGTKTLMMLATAMRNG